MAVWRGLFLREAVSRVSSSRAAWLWLLLEPVFHVSYLMYLFSEIRNRVVGGIETPVWAMAGVLAFTMFRRTGTQVMNAVGANQALFAYRQVKPVDTLIVRAFVEGFLMLVVSVIVLSGTALLNIDVIPADPLGVLAVFLGLWLFGLGFGLLTSVIKELLPEVGKVIQLLMTPMFLISGVIYPIGRLPQPYRGWLMLNPVAHGVDAARLAFAPHYQAAPELSIPYIYAFALVTVFMGLALQLRYADQLVAK